MTAPPAEPAAASRAALQVVAAATMWGVSGVVARFLFQRAVDPGHLVQVRMIVGGLALLPFAFRGGGLGLGRALPLLPVFAAALLGVQLMYFQAIAVAGVAAAIFLQYTSPLLVAGWEAARERRLPPRPVLVALGLATAGSALLALPGGSVRVPAAGIAWGLAASVAMAADTVIAGAMQRRGARPLPVLALGLLLGSVGFWPWRTPWAALATVPAGGWPGFLYIAILATAVPFALYVAALGKLRGTVVILIAMLEPVLAAGLAWLVLGEALAPLQLGGGALILAGIALAALGTRRA